MFILVPQIIECKLSNVELNSDHLDQILCLNDGGGFLSFFLSIHEWNNYLVFNIKEYFSIRVQSNFQINKCTEFGIHLFHNTAKTIDFLKWMKKVVRYLLRSNHIDCVAEFCLQNYRIGTVKIRTQWTLMLFI